jgi:hypothetical protein
LRLSLGICLRSLFLRSFCSKSITISLPKRSWWILSTQLCSESWNQVRGRQNSWVSSRSTCIHSKDASSPNHTKITFSVQKAHPKTKSQATKWSACYSSSQSAHRTRLNSSKEYSACQHKRNKP